MGPKVALVLHANKVSAAGIRMELAQVQMPRGKVLCCSFVGVSVQFLWCVSPWLPWPSLLDRATLVAQQHNLPTGVRISCRRKHPYRA